MPFAPLTAQIADGRTDLVFDLINSGHPATSSDSHGVSLLQHCAYYGDVSAIRFLLAHGASLRELGPNFDLNGACFHGHWRLTLFLLEQGANPNHPLPDTAETPLHAALSKPNRPAYDLIVDILLAFGANPNAPTLPNIETGSFMRDCRTKAETPLHRAAAFASDRAIRALLNAGADPTLTDSSGDTPLSYASWHQRPGIILHLLSHGPYSIRPHQIDALRADHGYGWGGMDHHLLGYPHLPPRQS